MLIWNRLLPVLIIIILFGNIEPLVFGQSLSENLSDKLVVESPRFFELYAISSADQLPEYPGGEIALIDYFIQNFRYPHKEKVRGIEGRVQVEFVINRKGQVRNARVINGVSRELDKKAVQLVLGMPEWQPGTENGRETDVLYTIQINFEIDSK